MNPTVKELRTAAWVLRWCIRDFGGKHEMVPVFSAVATALSCEADRIEAETPQVTPQEKPA